MEQNITTKNNKSKAPRIIQLLLASALLAGTIACGGSVATNLEQSKQDKQDIIALNEDLEEILTAIKASEEFQKVYNETYDVYTNAYNTNLMNETQYNNMLEKLNSNEFVEDYAFRTISRDGSLEKDFTNIKKQINTKVYQCDSRIFPTIISAFSGAACFGGSIASFISYGLNISRVDGKKKDENTLTK